MEFRRVLFRSFDWYLPQNILFQLYLMDIQSVIIEGGRKTLDLFIEAGLWDEARIFTSPHVWGAGVAAPICHAVEASGQQVGHDRLHIYYRNDHHSTKDRKSAGEGKRVEV